MQLIISGNPNIGTIRNVIYFANKHYEGMIKKVLFIDNESSLYNNGVSIESDRNEVVRNYIKNVSIESKVIEKSIFHDEIPKLLSDQLRLYNNDEIIVDLTNGNKFISSVLYASASLSRIKNLFFLFVSFDKLGKKPEELNSGDYNIDVISPLNNMESIGKYTYFEIVYYKEKIDNIINNFSGVKFNSSFLNNMFESQINASISNYFLEKYSECVSNIGQLIEEITIELCMRIKTIAKGKIKNKPSKSFDEAITWLRTNFCDPLRGKRNKELSDFEEKLKNMQNIDKIIDMVRVYRNLSSHPYEVLRGREDASLSLNNSIYILNLLDDSGVFL